MKSNSNRKPTGWWSLALSLAAALAGVAEAQAREDRIFPCKASPWYWQYQGEPVLLLGGSDDDNLCKWSGARLEEHLDEMVAVGANYVRNTMSDRDEGNVRPFRRLEDGRYDLDRWNESYWERFERLLQMTAERGIVGQIEIWDPWDLHPDSEPQGGWARHHFNPENNVNYTAEDTGLPTEIDQRPGSDPSGHRFYLSVPELDDIPEVLRYQEAFVDKMLDIALDCPNVLYMIHNEIGEPVEWGTYWARHVRQRAEEEGVEVHLTDIRRTNDINYSCYTSSYDMSAVQLHEIYKQRSTSETWIERVKGQTMAGPTLTNDFWANDILWQLSVLLTTYPPAGECAKKKINLGGRNTVHLSTGLLEYLPKLPEADIKWD